MQMKNTFTLKPLDRLVCAELKLSYIHKLSAPQETVKTRELFFDGFTARVKSLNLKWENPNVDLKPSSFTKLMLND